MPGERCPGDPRRVAFHRFFPRREVGRAWKRREHDELRERHARALRDGNGRVERGLTVARQPEDERAEHVDAVMLERTKPVHETLSRLVEALVHVFQPFGRHRFDSDERAFDARRLHRVQEVRILRRFHRDLREEHHVVGELGQPVHQLEPLRPDRAERLELRLIAAPRGHGQIGERDGIEIIIGERDEAEAAPPQLDDLAEDAIAGPLPRPLAVGLPDRAKRTVLRTASNGLDRRPHVPILRHQIPARGQEMLRLDASAVVDRVLTLGNAVVQHRAPDDVAVPLDDRMGPAQLMRLFRKQCGMNSAEHHLRTRFACQFADLVAAERVPGVNPDADDIARGDRRRVERLQRFVRDQWIPVAARRGLGEHVQPARGDDAGAEGNVARIDQMDVHICCSLERGSRSRKRRASSGWDSVAASLDLMRS